MGDEKKKKFCEEKQSNLPQLTYVGQYGEMWHGTIRQYKRTAINFYEMYDHCRLVHFGSKLTSLKIKKIVLRWRTKVDQCQSILGF